MIVTHSADLSHNNVTLRQMCSLQKMHIFPPDKRVNDCHASAPRSKQVQRAEVTHSHTLLQYLHYLCHHGHLEFITREGQGAGRCFI